jgi:hypothetical protein
MPEGEITIFSLLLADLWFQVYTRCDGMIITVLNTLEDAPLVFLQAGPVRREMRLVLVLHVEDDGYSCSCSNLYFPKPGMMATQLERYR